MIPPTRRPYPALPALEGDADPGNDPAANYLLTLRAGASRRSMRSTLATVAMAFGYEPHTCPWGALRVTHILAVRGRLQDQGYAPSTINRTLTLLKQIVIHANLIGMADDEDVRQLKHVRPDTGRRAVRPGRALSPVEVAALFSACDVDDSPLGLRDGAAFTLLAGCGLRLDEAVAVAVRDYVPSVGVLYVHGKGNRERTAYPQGPAEARLDAWLAVRGSAPGPLLVACTPAGRRLRGRAMSHNAIRKRLTLRARAAGLLRHRDPRRRRLSPHDLRRTFITRALEAEVDLAMVQALAGHASPTTTVRYDRRSEHEHRRAARRIEVIP